MNESIIEEEIMMEKDTTTESKNPTSSESTQLLDQMSQIVHPSSNENMEGRVIVTVHKARDLEKKDLMGKSDPYVVLSYGSMREKSATVKKCLDPVWHITACFDVDIKSAPAVTFEVFDHDIVGKDDFLGKAIIDISEIFLAKDFVNKWVPLEGCESGQICVSARFIPLHNISKPIGSLQVTVHKAKKIEKKNMLKKADPYVVVKLGKEEKKSQTVNNSQKPTWNFTVNLTILEESPRQLSLEVFDEDIGSDAHIGYITFEIDALMKKRHLENSWTKLENCKSGELLISVIFTPMSAVENVEESDSRSVKMENGITPDIINNKTTQQIEKETFAQKEGHCAKDMEILDPIYFDDEFVVVRKRTNTWFVVGFSLLFQCEFCFAVNFCFAILTAKVQSVNYFHPHCHNLQLDLNLSLHPPPPSTNFSITLW